MLSENYSTFMHDSIAYETVDKTGLQSWRKLNYFNHKKGQPNQTLWGVCGRPYER